MPACRGVLVTETRLRQRNANPCPPASCGYFGWLCGFSPPMLTALLVWPCLLDAQQNEDRRCILRSWTTGYWLGALEYISHYFADASSFPVQEYFQTAVTGVKKAELVYGPGGSSRGIANVVFHHSDGASKAYNKLNGLLIDNRPIRVS